MNHNYRVGVSFSRSVMMWVILVIPFFTCCSEKVSNTLDSAEACMIDRPDSSLTMLKTIDSGNIRTECNRARYALLYSQALDKNYIDLTNDSLINIAVDYYYNRSNVRYKFLSLYYSGRIYSNARDYTKAILAYSDAETLIEELSDDYLVGLLYSQLGDIYLSVYDHDKSLSSYLSASGYYKKAGKSKHEYYCLLDIGLEYLNLLDFENGLKYINDALNQAKEANDTSLVFDCLSNLTILRMANGDIDSVKILKNAICRSTDFEDMGPCLLGSLAHMYALTNRPDSAEILIKQAWKNAADAGDSVTLFFRSANVYESQGKFEKSLKDLWKGVSIQRRILVNLLSQPMLAAQKKYYKDKSEFYNYRLKVAKYFMICIITIVILIISLFIILFRKRLNKKDLEIEQHLNVINEIKNTSEQDISKTLYQAKKQLLYYFEEVNNIGDAYYEISDTEKGRKKFLSDFKSTIDKFSKDNEYYMKIENTVNEYNDNIMSKLRHCIPGIKESDYRLLCYTIIGFSNKFISILQDDNPHNIATRKSRLRARINNSDCGDKDQLSGFLL